MPTLKDLHITPVTMDNDTDALNKKVDAQNAIDLKNNKTSTDNKITFSGSEVNNVIDPKNITGSKKISIINVIDPKNITGRKKITDMNVNYPK
jgi:hypothetical protein